MAPKIGPAVATLVALVVVLRKVLKSPAALRRFLGLEQVPPAELKFAPPNEAVPENVRGVWWIDAGPGVVTVDLNRLVPATSGEFYAQDAEPEYQTVSDDLTGLRLMLFATFCAVRSHVRVDADGPQVSWSLGRGALPLPLSSPSKRVDEHVVRRYIINSSGKTLASYFARRIIDAAGQKTEHLEAMLSRFSHVLQVLLSVDEVFWTVPGEEAEADTAQLHADQEDQSCFGQRSAVWRYPLPVFLRKTAEGTVEGLLHPPEADGVADGKAVRFCVRAVDPITGSTSMMGDLGPPIQLPSAAEVILRNVDAVNQIGEGAVRAGGFKRFLEDAEDAGLIGGEGTEVDLRKQLYEKVESAGGLESMLEALADLQMKNFKEACEVVRSIQESTELTAEETPSWQHVVKLVAGAGGAKKFTRSFTTVELAEVLGNTQQLAALGIFEGKSEDHTLRDALLTNDEHMPQFFSKIQEELGGLTLDERQVADLSSALGIMARRSKGNWTELVDLIAGEGGPTPVQPLVKYSEGHVQELHSAMQLSSLDAAPSSKL